MKKQRDAMPKGNNSMVLYAIFMVSVLIPLLIVGFFINKILDNYITSNYLEATNREIKQVENAYNMFFKNYMEKVAYLSKNYFVMQADDTITTYMDRNEEVFITPSQNGGIEEEIYSVFKKFIDTHPNLVYVYMGTKYGGYIQCPEGPVMVNYDPRKRPFYIQALDSGDQVVKGPPYDWFGNQLISLTKQVKNEHGQFVGVVGVDINLRELAVMLSGISIGDSGFVVLTQDDGTIITDSRYQYLVLQNINDFFHGISFNNGQGEKESFIKININNTDYLVTSYSSSELGMKFIAFIEESELTSLKKDMVAEMSGTVLATFFVIAIMLYFAVKHVTGPIVKLSQSLDRLSSYDFAFEDEELRKYQKRRDEIGVIARAVDRMKTNITALIQDINNSEVKFRAFVSNVPGIVYRCANDADWTMEFISNEIENISGYPSSDFINSNVRSYASVIHPEDREEVSRTVQSALMKREFFKTNYRLLKKDGGYRWVNGKGQGIFDFQNRLICIDGVIMDVTDQILAEKEIYNQKAHFQALFTNTLDAIVYFDTNSNISNVNSQFVQMFGYEHHEVIGKNINSIIDPFNKAADYVSPEILKGQTIERETIRYTKSGKPVNVHLKGSPVFIDGVITGGYISYSNINERKRYEQELKYLSLYDKLTGVYNRTFFEAEIKRLQNSRQYPITIMSADIDGLKLINDTLGHDLGDELLKVFARILKENLRSGDIISRVGGDEFVILLPGTSETISARIAGRIQFSEAQYNNDNQHLPLSISLGTTTVSDKNTSLSAALKTADDAMYRSKLRKGASAKSQILNALMATLGERDYITEGHAQRVGHLCLKVGREIGLSSNQLDNLALLAQVHDLGKVGIPDHILFKKGPLTQEEWAIMTQHTEKGYRIASSSPDLLSVADLILKHHEKWDGTGYPLGLKGKSIPIECRILSIIDAFDAMTNERPYSKTKTIDEALQEIRRCSGTHFDPELVEVFLSVQIDAFG